MRSTYVHLSDRKFVPKSTSFGRVTKKMNSFYDAIKGYIMELKDNWDEESAMQVLKHPTVDARLWAEAVEWLILYGPAEVRELLLQSAGTATHECFPDLQAKAYAADGQPCYSVEDLAQSLNISTDEAKAMIKEKENSQNIHHFIDEQDTMKIQ